MKLLLERIQSSDTEILTEKTNDGQKRMFITGPFLMFDKKNQNGRVYPQSVMDAAVEDYTKRYVKQNRALGELNHPAGRIQVDPERSCILVTELTKDKNYYMGKAKVLSTPLGKILESLLNDGVKIGVSSRGAGSVKKFGSETHVQPDFRLTAAADIVHDPSVTDAFVESLMEQKEYMLVNGIIVEKDLYEIEAKKKVLKSAQFQEEFIKQFEGLFKSF